MGWQLPAQAQFLLFAFPTFVIQFPFSTLVAFSSLPMTAGNSRHSQGRAELTSYRNVHHLCSNHHFTLCFIPGCFDLETPFIITVL